MRLAISSSRFTPEAELTCVSRSLVSVAWYSEFVFKYGCAEPGDASWEVTDPVICNFGQIQRNPSESLNGY